MKKTVQELTNAARAEAVFKPVNKPAAPLDERAVEKKAFDDNRERLKSERLAREAARSEVQKKPVTKLRRFYETTPLGRRTDRLAYVTKTSTMPDVADGSEWTEDVTFNAAEAILHDPNLKDVYAAAIKDGCAIAKGAA